MTYYPQLKSTPEYLNMVYSPFWSCMAKEACYANREYCKHSSNYLNLSVTCFKSPSQKVYVDVICQKCKTEFKKAAKDIQEVYLKFYGF